MQGLPRVGKVKFFNPQPREAALERWACRLVKRLGGRPYKFVSPGHRSVPDRIMAFPGEHLFLCEFKRKGKHLTPKQALEVKWWRNAGFRVYVCDTKEKVMAMLADEYVL